MGDGKIIEEHAGLLIALGAGFSAVFFFVRALLNAIDNRQHENMRLFFTNGGRAILQDAAKVGASEALKEHALICPQMPRVENLEERLHRIEHP